MSGLNLNFEILGEILVSDTGGEGSIIFHHVWARSQLYKFLGKNVVGDTGGGGQSSIIMSGLNL